MIDNPIPENQRCDHLFLLVGTNPLPLWVATRLLLQESGHTYLIHSDTTSSIARRLAKKLLEDGYRQPRYVPIRNGSDAFEVYEAVAAQVKQIQSGQIGLNYTGGTKVMAVHSYRAVEQAYAKGLPPPLFSYLDARTLQMHFDRSARLPHGYKPLFVGLAKPACISIRELFALHDEVHSLTKAKQEAIALPVAQAIAQLHGTEAGYKSWREWTLKLTRLGKQLDGQTLAQWSEAISSVTYVLAQGRPLTITLKELCREKIWPFTTPQQLAAWLEGEWLEGYVLDFLVGNQKQYYINDYAQDLRCRFTGFSIQADVAAMRGYQLYFISCYTGHSTQSSTFKLIEATTRARQIGGDEAGAALVCMTDDPQGIENDVARTWQEGRVKVFGRRDLPNLQSKLGEWFQEGISR